MSPKRDVNAGNHLKGHRMWDNFSMCPFNRNSEILTRRAISIKNLQRIHHGCSFFLQRLIYILRVLLESLFPDCRSQLMTVYE